MAVSGSGQIVIIKRDGSEGSSYPLITGSISIGSAKDCNIRVTSKGFPEKQCVITVNNSEARIENLSTDTPTILNGKPVQNKILSNGDIISFNNSKFKWEYTNKTPKIYSRKSSGSRNKPSFVVKYTRKSFNSRKSEPYSKIVDTQSKNNIEIKTRNTISNIQASTTPKTRQVAVVMPQRRNTELPEKIMPSERQRNRTKSENIPSTARSRRNVNNNSYLKDAGILASGSKFKKSNRVEKLEDTDVIDKNKKAALMLLSRSPNNKNIFKPNIQPSPTNISLVKSNNTTPAMSRNTRKFNSVSAKPLHNNVSHHNGVSSESRLPKNHRSSRIPIKSVRKSIANKIKPIIGTPAKLSKVKNSDVKNVSFNLKLDYSNIESQPEETASTFKIRSRSSKIASPGRYAILSGKKPRNSIVNNTNSSNHKFGFDISGVEGLSDGESYENTSKTKSQRSPEGKRNSVKPNTSVISDLNSPKIFSENNTPNNKTSSSVINNRSISRRSNVIDDSVNIFSPIGKNSISNGSILKDISEDNMEEYNLITSTLKKRGSLGKSKTPLKSNKTTPKTPYTRKSVGNYSNGNASAVKSFISTLTNALHVVNNSGTDLESVVQTPEYRALSNHIKSFGKLVDSSQADSPSPVILEIGVANASGRTTRSSIGTPNDQKIISSPIISPKLRASLTPESPDTANNVTDIITTPNLSKLFEVDASTPMDYRKSSVIDKIRLFEAKSRESSTPNNLRKSNRKSSASAGRIVKNKTLRSSLPVNKRSFINNSSSDDSNVTDINAPEPDNEIVITPKSTIKPIPEIVKEKHSTAKKSVSRKVLIDHLTESPDIAKELFKSPVKRKLSQSMRQYNSSILSDDDSILHDSSFNLLTRSTKRSESSTDIELILSDSSETHTINGSINIRGSKFSKTPNNSLNKSNIKLSPKQSTRKNTQLNKSPKNDLTDVRGVKRLLKTPKSPKNDLTDVRGVRRLLKNNKSPKNDLRNISGIEKILRTPSARLNKSRVSDISDILLTPIKFYRSPHNDLTDVRGVKNLLKTPHAKKSPKNDLRNVSGVRKLLKTPHAKKSPKNDLRNISGVQKLLKTPRARRSPKNDLRNVSGVKKLLKTPNKNPKNDLTNISGIRELFSTVKSDLSNVSGLPELFVTPNQKSRDSLKITPKSENLFDQLVGRTPVRTYSDTKRSISPKKSIDKDESIVVAERSVRQATADKTRFSIEVGKAYFKPKSDVSDEIPSDKDSDTKPKRKQNKPKTPVKSSPKVRATRRNKKDVESASNEVVDVKSPKRVTRTRKNAAIVKDTKVVAKKSVKTAKKTTTEETQVMLSPGTKKKVTFASDVDLKSDEDKPTKKKVTAKNTAKAKVEDQPVQRARRGTTVASTKASAFIEKIVKSPKVSKAKAESKTTKETLVKSRVTRRTPVEKVVAEKTPKKASKKVIEPVVEISTPKGRKRAAPSAVTKDKKKAKDDKPAASKVSPVKSANKIKKKAKVESSPLVIRKTRSTAARKK